MPRARIQRRLKKFCDYIFSNRLTKQEALEIRDQIDDYCQRNKVTPDERQVIASSGAGEILSMLCSMAE